MTTETIKTSIRCRIQVRKTAMAVRRLGWEVGLEGGASGVALGKKRRKRKSLDMFISIYSRDQQHLKCCENLHDSKTHPLNTDLSDAQQSSHTIKPAQFFATSQISLASRQRKDVRESTSAGCSAQEDEVRGYAIGGAPDNDTMMLRKVGDEDPKEDESRYAMSGLEVLRTTWLEKNN